MPIPRWGMQLIFRVPRQTRAKGEQGWRFGALCHALDEEGIEEFRAVGGAEDNVVTTAAHASRLPSRPGAKGHLMRG